MHSKEEIEPEFMEDLRVSGYSPLLPPQIIQEELPMVRFSFLSFRGTQKISAHGYFSNIFLSSFS